MRTSLTQEVKQFFDEETLIEQTFLIDDNKIKDFNGEPWVIVENNDKELSLSLTNWKKLVEMANIVINKYEEKNETLKKALLIFIFSLNSCLFAQNNNSLSISGGFVQENSYGGLLNYNYNINNSNYEIGVLHSIFNFEPTPEVKSSFSTTTLQLGYLHTLIRSRTNSIFFNTGIGLFAGTENVKKSDDYIVKNDGEINAGVYGVGQLDFYTSDNFAFVLRAQENYNFKSTTGKMNPYFGFGLKFNF